MKGNALESPKLCNDRLSGKPVGAWQVPERNHLSFRENMASVHTQRRVLLTLSPWKSLSRSLVRCVALPLPGLASWIVFFIFDGCSRLLFYHCYYFFLQPIWHGKVGVVSSSDLIFHSISFYLCIFYSCFISFTFILFFVLHLFLFDLSLFVSFCFFFFCLISSYSIFFLSLILCAFHRF